MMSSTMAAMQTAVKRASIGTCVCSYAYFKANAMPKNSTTTPTRTTVLPPMNQRQMNEGSRGGRDARRVGAAAGAAGVIGGGPTRTDATGSSMTTASAAVIAAEGAGSAAGTAIGAGAGRV